MNDDKIKINLQLADGSYPLTIKREEEEIIRKAARQVNNRINVYRTHYSSLPSERILAMVAYELALENLKLKEKNDTEPFINTIEKLTQELEEYFRKE